MSSSLKTLIFAGAVATGFWLGVIFFGKKIFRRVALEILREECW